jgi:hypothetical protein
MVARFSQPPTLGEVIQVAKKYGFRVGTTPGVLGPRGMLRIHYLVRGGPGSHWKTSGCANRRSGTRRRVQVRGSSAPARELTRIGSVETYTTAERGFNVIMWRTRELGYALVSNVDARELRQLAVRMAGGQ